MKCAKCGNALQAGERFCGECGTPVTVATPSPIAAPPATAPDPVRQSVTPPPGARQPSPPAASRRGLMLALSGVGVAGGLGFLTYVRTTPVPFWVPSTPTPLPTATPIPPTPTPVPTATPVPPTPTPGPKRLVVDAAGSGDYRTIASAGASLSRVLRFRRARRRAMASPTGGDGEGRLARGGGVTDCRTRSGAVAGGAATGTGVTTVTGVPHSPQNRSPACSAFPHFAHFMSEPISACAVMVATR